MAKFVFRESFDTYNGSNSPIGFLNRWLRDGGAGLPTLMPGRFLGQSLGAIYQDSFMRALDEPVSSFCIGTSFKQEFVPASRPSPGFMTLFNDEQQPMLSIGVDVDASLYVHRNSGQGRGPLLGRSAPGLIQGSTWNFIEWEVTLHDTAGQFKVYVNGNPTPAISVSGVDTMANPGPLRYLGIFNWGTEAGSGGIQQFDDMYIWDEPARRGPIRIESLKVNGNGAHQDFAPSTGTDNAACIDEALPNISDYVIGTTPGQYDEYTMTNLSSSSASVFEVNLVMLGQQTGSTIRAMALGLDSGGTVSDGPDIYMGSGFARYERRLLKDPNGNVDWTKASVDALILRPKITV